MKLFSDVLTPGKDTARRVHVEHDSSIQRGVHEHNRVC